MSTAAFWTGIIVFVFIVWAGTRDHPTWPGFSWFERVISPTTGDSAHSFYKLLVLAILFVVCVFAVGAIEISISNKPENFGDFVGGVAAPILNFFTFFGLLITIVLQQQTNAQARSEAETAQRAFQEQLHSQKRDSFESTFFQMLNLHNTIVNSMDIQRREKPDLKGRDCFRFFADDLEGRYDKLVGHSGSPDELIQRAYTTFWDARQQDLGHYFRYLYNVVRFIDQAQPDDVRYIKLLRAQLSDYELLMLFYNARTVTGSNFRHYIERYSLFDNLPPKLLFEDDHYRLYAPAAWGR